MASKSKKSFKSPLQPFTLNFQDSISFRAWFTILSLPDQSSSGFTDIILSGLEYIQLIIQAILLNQVLYTSATDSTPRIISIFIGFCDTLNPGYNLAFEQSQKGFALAIFFTLLCYTVLKYGLFAYIVMLTFKRTNGPKIILKVWSWVFRLQGRFIYLFISSIWSSLFRAGYENQLGLSEGFNAGIMIISDTMIIIEFVFSFILLTQFSYSVPSKRFMTSKNQYTEAITLTQKFVVQFLRNLLSTNLVTLAWIRNSLALSFCLIRDVYYLNSFPHYRLKATLYKSSLMTAVTCLNISYLMEMGLTLSYIKDLKQEFGLVMSIILTILLVSFWNKYIKRVWLRMILRESSSKQGLLIHQILAIKDLAKFNTGSPGDYKKHSLSYLFSAAATTKIRSFLEKKQATSLENENNWNSKEGIGKFMKLYLPELVQKYPSNDLIKLYAASYFAQRLKLYGQPMKILHELKSSSNYNTALSANILTYTIEESLKADYRNQKNKIDLYTYMKNMSVLAQLKAEIFIQAEVQVKLYEHLTRSPQDLGKVFDLAQKVNQQRGKVAKKIQSMVDTIPGYFLEPIMLSAHYSLVLNHSPHQYRLYCDIYNQRNRKFEKVLLSETMCQENLHHKYDHILLVSGNKRDMSRVRYVSKSLSDRMFGKNVVDQHFCSVLPAHLKEQVYPVINMVLELGNKAILGTVANSFYYHFPGEYFVPCEYYCNINPFFNQGLSYLMIIRTNMNPQEYIAIDNDGNIAGFTNLLGQELGLFGLCKQFSADKKINIGLISSELARINHAFNMVLSPDEYPNDSKASMNSSEAKDLHSTFSTTGAEIKFDFLKQNDLSKDRQENESYTYHCKFEIRRFSTLALRAIALQRVQIIASKLKDDYGSRTCEELALEVTNPPNEEEDESEFENSVPSENISKVMSGKNDDRQHPNTLKIHSSNKLFLKNTNSSPQNLAKRRFNQSDSEQENLSSTRKLITPRHIGEPIRPPKEISSPIPILNEDEELNVKVPRKNPIYDKAGRIDEMSQHQSSQFGKRRTLSQVSKDFHTAVYSKYYPISSKFTVLLLYIVFLIVLVCQISFKQTVEDDMQTFQARTNVAMFVMNRTDLLTSVYSQTRSVWIFAVGQQNQSDYPVAVRAPAVMSRMNTSLLQLSQVNKDLMITMSSLDFDCRERLFEDNVRMFDTTANETQESSFINMTTFQAIDSMIESNSRGLVLGNTSLQDAVPDFEVVLINAMNDLLVESELLAFYLDNSVVKQKGAVLARNVGNLAVNISLLSFILTVYCVFVYHQYQNEKHNMSAVAKLDLIEVGIIMNKVTNFQKMLQDETRFDGLPRLDTSNLSKGKALKSQYLNAKHKINAFAQQAIFTGILRKYQRYPLKFIVLILIMTVLILAKYLVTKTSVTDISYVFNQINFIYRSRPRIQIDNSIMIDLVSDKTALLRNTPLLPQFEKEQYFLQNATHNMSGTLQTKGSTYDPVINGILFDNACNYISKTHFLIESCDTLSKNSTNTGLIAFMTGYQSTLTNFETAYNKPNQTQEDLIALSLATNRDRVSSVMVISDLMTVIANQLGLTFSQTIAKAKTSSVLSSSLVFLFLFGICGLLHIRTINRVKEAENQFRNVLKVFPAKLVLSNFMLKFYLMRTWKGTLDSSKLSNTD